MFNRQPFNKGKFNVSCIEKSVNFYGFIDISLEAVGNINAISTLQGEAEAGLFASGNMNYTSLFSGNSNMALLIDGFLVNSKPFKGNAIFSITSNGNVVAKKSISGIAVLTLKASSEGFKTYQEEYISLPGIILRTGDELIINTDEMTVTLNGQNVVQYLSRDSEFFLFNPHENDIIYTSANPNDKVDIKILWKDAYL